MNVPPGVTPLDGSSTIAAGGTAQALFAANPNRKGATMQNTSAGDLWINEIGTATAASPSWQIVPGATWSADSSGVPTGAISIYGASTGQTFTAREW